MKISTKGRYALRLMLDLAEHQNEGFIALKDIAERQNISKKYLEQIVPMLKKAGLLRTNRGYQGGYQLSRQPSEYTLGDILRVTEGSLAPVSCINDVADCPNSDSCITLDVWIGLNKVVNEYVDNLTLQDILDNYRQKCIDEYYI